MDLVGEELIDWLFEYEDAARAGFCSKVFFCRDEIFLDEFGFNGVLRASSFPFVSIPIFFDAEFPVEKKDLRVYILIQPITVSLDLLSHFKNLLLR